MKRVIGGIAAIVAITATSLVAGSASAQSDDRVTLLHGVPGVPVDVSVDGSVVFPNVQPNATEDLTSFRGQTLIDVQLLEPGTTNPVTDPQPLPIPDTGSHNIVAHLDAAGDVVITSFENDVSATTDAANGRLTVRHTAAADSVDVVIGGDRPIQGIAPGGERILELAAGTISGAQLAPAGEAPTATLPDLTITAGTNLILYVVGPGSGGAIEFYTQTAQLAAPATTTTDPNATTTTSTTDPNATTTTTTTTTSTTTTTEVVPVAVNTGSPLDNSVSVTLIAIALGGALVAGTAMLARRRVT